MNKFVKNFISLCLVVLILMLVLNRLNIVVFTYELKEIFTFITSIFIVISSTASIILKTSKIDKFLGSIMLSTLIVGGVLTIINPDLNIFVLVCLGTSLLYSLKDMLYKGKL